MPKQKSFAKIPDPEYEEYFIIRKDDALDLDEAIRNISTRRKFWDGLRWAIMGGFFSALFSTLGYHLFEDDPSRIGLVVGYMLASFLLIWSISIGKQSRHNDVGRQHYKNVAERIMTRVLDQNHLLMNKLNQQEDDQVKEEKLMRHKSQPPGDYELNELTAFRNVFGDLK